MSNIVQVEFFRGGKRTLSLGELLDEQDERVKDGLELVKHGIEPTFQIKTVVRFAEEGNALTALAKKFEGVNRQSVEVGDQLFRKVRKDGIRQWVLNLKSRRLAGRSLAIREEAREVAIKHLRKVIQKSQKIAIEQSDHSFRLACRNELHELLESAIHSDRVWLFVFADNNLLSNKNTLVAHVAV